jgi:hypothetical protein
VSAEALPTPAHLASEFCLWLWWRSEVEGAALDLGEPVGRVDIWVDERLGFRSADDTRVTVLLTGDNPSATLEARAALAGGKQIAECRLGLRRDDREFLVTLKGPALHLAAVKLPSAVTDGGPEAVWERMHLTEELVWVLGAAFGRFAALRASPEWGETRAALRAWVQGDVDPRGGRQ